MEQSNLRNRLRVDASRILEGKLEVAGTNVSEVQSEIKMQYAAGEHRRRSAEIAREIDGAIDGAIELAVER